MYKCPQCGHTADQEGTCPTCNVPMVEAQTEEGVGAEEGTEQATEGEASETPESAE